MEKRNDYAQCSAEHFQIRYNSIMEANKEREKTFISAGPTEAFLICDRSLEKITAPFFQWLHNENFVLGDHHGNFGCWWVYVNITRKMFAYGMPGIEMVRSIGNHAITIDEFKTIYQIYKKYEGKDTYVFHKNRFDYDV